jgi:hypothetical protein
MFPTARKFPARRGSLFPRGAAAAGLAAMLALAGCESPTGGPADPLRPLPAMRSVTASATLATYTDRAAWEAAVAAAGGTVQALDFAGMTLGRVTQLDTDYGDFRIVVDRLSASEFSNPGISIFPDASCSLGTGDCDVFTFNVEDPAPLFPLNGPRVNQLVFPEPVAAFGGDFIQLGATAPTGTPTGPVTLQAGSETLVVNDYLDAQGNGFFGFVATAPATTLAFTFARSGTIGNDIFQVYNPAVAFGAAEATPEEQVAALRTTVAGLGLRRGMAASLDAKLRAALAAMAAGDTAGACTALQDLLSQLAAQSGKRITAADAALLGAAAAGIREDLGC